MSAFNYKLFCMSGLITEQDPFAAQDAAWLNQFLTRVTPEQALFLRGFLAAQSGGITAAAPQAAEPLTILFGTESGNAEALAAKALAEAKDRGFKATVKGMDTYKTKDLAKEKNILVIVSTWGEGDPPESAIDFYEFLHGEKAPKLPNVKYAVMSLGDSSYEHFCQTGKDFDKRFAELGATRAFDRVDSDVDFDEPYARFMSQVWDNFSAGSTGGAVAAAVTAPVAVSSYDRKNPFPATVIENINLNGRGSAKETRHIEIDLEGSGLSYQAGDALGVYPSNCPDLVAAMIKAGGFSEDTLVPTPSGEEKALAEALFSDYDITTVSKPFLKKYLELGSNPKLEELLSAGKKEELSSYLWGRDIVDILEDFPVKGLDAKVFVGLLRKMPARLYSIASSILAHPEEVHLTVGAVRYNTGSRERKGVCSTFLADRLEGDVKVPVYMHANKNFKLPQDGNTPIIMVGPGTGIAPFRAFVEERVALDAKGKNWLFFGDQHHSTDFLYQTEWQDYVKTGVINKIDLAFSRDTDEKVYVQHRMAQNSKELYQWLEEGAYFYVCGDASKMAKDVHDTLIEVVAKESGQGEDFAKTYVKDLQKQKRYQRDVY